MLKRFTADPKACRWGSVFVITAYELRGKGRTATAADNGENRDESTELSTRLG